jgi:hypothetical protein
MPLFLQIHRSAASRIITSMMRRLFVLLLLSAPLAWAQAPAVTPEDARAVRAVIQAQLNAFRRDDAALAFSYAAPGIRATFGSAENFMEMVRTQYAVVYRPKSVTFESLLVSEGDVVQVVRFTDAGGQAWQALYPMQRAADGTWRIGGCYLQRAAGKQT